MSNVLVRRAVVCSAAFGLLAACSSSKSISSGSGETTTTAAATTVPATAAPTTVADTVAPTTAAPPPPSCADATAPSAGAVSVTIIDGDWNGDGISDTGVSWGEPSGGGAAWFMRAEVTGGLSSTVGLGDLGVGYAQALDNVDVDFSLGAEPGVNRDEMIAIVGGGASGVNLGIFGVGADGCVFQFDDGAGAPFETPIAASIGQRSGLTCEGAMGSHFLVVLHASTADDFNFDTGDYRLEREGDHSLVLGTVISGTLIASDAALDRYSQAECGGVVWVA
ncbi:MAG: hypothetical protein ABL953_03985 [Ilumatobacteraceae bacterium]